MPDPVEEWQPFDKQEGDLRIAIFEEIRKNDRLCYLLRCWNDRSRDKYRNFLWWELFEGWKRDSQG